jgi:hypothetical protein
VASTSTRSTRGRRAIPSSRPSADPCLISTRTATAFRLTQCGTKVSVRVGAGRMGDRGRGLPIRSCASPLLTATWKVPTSMSGSCPIGSVEGTLRAG